MRTELLPYRGVLAAAEAHSKTKLKQIDIKVSEVEATLLDKFPWFIEGEEVTKENPVGILDYKMRIYRTKHSRVVTANNIFYLKDPAERPIKVSLTVKVGCDRSFNNKYDNEMFDIAYAYSKAVLDSSDYSCPGPDDQDIQFKVDFHLPDSYKDIDDKNTKRYDGYDTLKVIERN